MLGGQKGRKQQRQYGEIVVTEDGQQAVTGDEEEGDGRHPSRDAWKEGAEQEPDRHRGHQQKDALVPPAEDQPRQCLQREREEELAGPGDEVMQCRAGKALPPGRRGQTGASVVGAVGVGAMQHEVAGQLRLERAITDQGLRGCHQVPAEDGPGHRQRVEHRDHRRGGQRFRPWPDQHGHDQGHDQADAGHRNPGGQRPGDGDLPIDGGRRHP